MLLCAGVVYSGMGPDFRVLVRKGQKKAQAYALQYGENIPVLELVREMGAIMQVRGATRPAQYTAALGIETWACRLHPLEYDTSEPHDLTNYIRRSPLPTNECRSSPSRAA